MTISMISSRKEDVASIPVIYRTTDRTTRFFGMAPGHPFRKALGFMKVWSRERDSNPQPPLYESGALPLSYLGTPWGPGVYSVRFSGASFFRHAAPSD